MGGFSRSARSLSDTIKETGELTDMLCKAIAYVEKRGRLDIAEYLMGEVEDIAATNCRTILEHGIRRRDGLIVAGDIVRVIASGFTAHFGFMPYHLTAGQLVKVIDVTEEFTGPQQIKIIKLAGGTICGTSLRSSDVEKVDASEWKEELK